MFRKKNICIVFLFILCIFFILIYYILYNINTENSSDKVRITTSYSIETIEHKIQIKTINLPEEYTKKQVIADITLESFQKNVVHYGKELNFNSLWREFDEQINKNQIFNSNNPNLGNIILALKTAKILKADVYSKGTQLKLILQLEGDHLAVFKPQWYDKQKIILGNVYSGKDRVGSEIFAFYLAGILNLRLVPIVTGRSLDIRREILPVASAILNNTKFEYKDQICIYGKCFYCKREDPVCTGEDGKIEGAIIFHVPGKLQSYNSPWQRTYKKGKRALWETQYNYCTRVKAKISKTRILDLVDVSIFDFLIQNGDRHHYEVLNDKVLLLDNGKGLGNPYVHHLDILAPLYQCCILRRSTWEKLKLFSGRTLSEILKSFSEVRNVVWGPHFTAMDERLNMIYATVENCKDNNNFELYENL